MATVMTVSSLVDTAQTERPRDIAYKQLMNVIAGILQQQQMNNPGVPGAEPLQPADPAVMQMPKGLITP